MTKKSVRDRTLSRGNASAASFLLTLILYFGTFSPLSRGNASAAHSARERYGHCEPLSVPSVGAMPLQQQGSVIIGFFK